MEDIAATAVVSVRTIYLHFDSKTAILLAYFNEWTAAVTLARQSWTKGTLDPAATGASVGAAFARLLEPTPSSAVNKNSARATVSRDPDAEFVKS